MNKVATSSEVDESTNCDQTLAAPVLHDRSNLSHIQSPTTSKHSTHRVGEGRGEAAVEAKALQAELNTSQCPSFGLGSQTSGNTDHTTEDMSSTGISRDANGAGVELPTDVATYQCTNDPIEHASGEDSTLPEDVDTTRREKSTEDTSKLSIKAEKDANESELTLPKDVTTNEGVNNIDVLSPMTPLSFSLSKTFNRSMDSDSVNEGIAGLSPILATRESDVASAQSTSWRPHVSKSNTEVDAQDGMLNPSSPSSRESTSHTSVDHSWSDDLSQNSSTGRSVPAPEKDDADVTKLSPAVAESYESIAVEDNLEASNEKSTMGPSIETSNASTEYDEDHVDIISVLSTSAETDSPVEVGPSSPAKEEEHEISMTIPKVGIEENNQRLSPTSPPVEVKEKEIESSLTSNRQADSMIPEAEDEKRRTELESSLVYRDLTSAKKHLDASSLAFIERLRGAAHRRKLQVARSRDSLAAKELEQLLSIASAKERQLAAAPDAFTEGRPSFQGVDTTVDPYRPFKARPVPSATGHLGSGGQVGVPKVEKKPTTTPFSPLLGARRLEQESAQSVSQPVGKVHKSINQKQSEDRIVPFKARPAPPTTGMQGHGGQAGVPKIAKRPVTVPSSPCLGKKRSSLASNRIGVDKPGKPISKLPSSKVSLANKGTARGQPFERLLAGNDASRAKEEARRKRLQREAVDAKKAREFRARPLPKSVLTASSNSSRTMAFSPVLLGLKILNQQGTPTTDGSGTENIQSQLATPSNRHSGITAYTPHSTIRAKKRASFDQRRAANEILRHEEQRKLRQSIIKQKRAEISKLRDSLR